jgi:hypothetical protein
MNWKHLKRANLIYELSAAAATVGAIVWTAIKGVSLPATPLWVVLAIGIVILLGGIAIGKSLPRRGATNPANAIHVFDYRDFWPPLESRGWTFHGPRTTTEYVEIVSDTEFGKVARVDLPSGVAMDRLLPHQCRSARALEFVGELDTIYASVIIRSSTVSTSRKVWLKYRPGAGPPTPCDGSEEWSFHVHPSSQQHRWPVYHLDLVDSIHESFGRSGGWYLAEVMALRLRGKSAIAQIGLLKERAVVSV